MKLKLFISYVTASLVLLALEVSQAHAVGTIQDGASAARSQEQPTDLIGEAGVFSKVSSILLFIVGAVAVIMIIIGGLRYVISGGDSTQIQSAKNTIMYAIIGVIVALLAYAAINFVLANFVPTSSPGATGPYGASTR